MKRLLLGLCLASGLCFAGCTKSVDSEIKDVKDAQRAKSDKVKEELREAEDVARDGDKKIQKEANEANEAIRREANRTDPTAPGTAPAPVTPAPVVP
jgi:hypothetical protein